MPKAISNLLTKEEIKFWMGIIAVILAIVVANNNVVIELALMNQEIATLTKASQATNDKFDVIHAKTNTNSTSITVINTILEID